MRASQHKHLTSGAGELIYSKIGGPLEISDHDNVAAIIRCDGISEIGARASESLGPERIARSGKFGCKGVHRTGTGESIATEN